MSFSRNLLLLHGLCASLVSSAVLLSPRSTQQGWSLQSSTCPSGSSTCGSGACCPTGLYCNAASQDEVAACCSSSSNCVGAVEGGPKCADSSWSLWKGLQGNSFCCENGLTGYYTNAGPRAGSCGSSVPSGSTQATLMTPGSGTPPPPPTTTTSTTSPKPTTSTSTGSSPGPTGKGTKDVFAHYLIGTMTSDEAVTDIKDAMAVGFDGFALNTPIIDQSYATDAVSYLFAAAAGTGFKLFFSYDTSYGSGGASMPDFAAFVAQYATNDAYYTVSGRPFISTFDGGTYSNDDWQSNFIQPLINDGLNPFFVPDFDDTSGYPNGFFSEFPVVNGAYSWESAWTPPGTTISNVSDAVDQSMIQQAQAAGKVYMMPVSTFQFKYLGSGQDYYRVGEANLPQRIGQALELQPDFVEVITWNDAGEGHYVGNFWPEQISCCADIQAYADGFDHTGWQQVITPFIKAYKAGVTDVSGITPTSGSPEGAMWYRTLLTTASCSSTISNYQEAQDAINYAVILPAGASGYSIKVYSNGQLLETVAAQPGLNGGMVLGLQAGSASTQKIEVVNSSGSVVSSATGTKDVLTESNNGSLCNWNYEVVGLS